MVHVSALTNANVLQDGLDTTVNYQYAISVANIMVTALYQTHALVKRDGLALIAQYQSVPKTVTMVENV